MPDILWKYAQNTFDTVTEGSHVKMLSIATDSEAKLQAENSDPDINALYTGYFPVYDAYRLININYDVQAGNREGSTLNLETLLKEGLPLEVRKWEAQVRIIYLEDTPQERSIFPNKHNSFLQGTYEDRISAVGTLAARLADDSNATLIAYAPTVQSYYNLLLSARDGQQIAEGTLNALSATREAQRKLVATELYGVLGGLMRKFKADPPQIMRFFDMSLLRETGQLTQIRQIANVVAAGASNTEGVLEAEAVQANITVLTGGPIEFGITQNGTTFIGDTIVVNAANGTVEFPFEDVPPGVNTILIKNLNGTEASGYQVEIYA